MKKYIIFVIANVVFLGYAAAGARLEMQHSLNEWRDQVLYFVLIDRFENGCKCDDFDVNPRDPGGFHGGDLEGVRARLPYLQELGVTGIWLSPVARNRPMRFYGRQPYHGYWIWDHFTFDPRFGTMRKLRELCQDLHRRGMKLLLDMVVNHAGYDAPIAKEKPELFHQTDEIRDWNDREQLESGRLFGLPDFASEKPGVQLFFDKVARHWIETIHPDGFRLDAVKHVPLGFWKHFNGVVAMTAGREFLSLGELLDGNPTVMNRTWREGGFTSLFDYPLYYTVLDVIARGGDARQLGVRFGMDRIYPEAGMLSTFLDNHDLDRFMTSCGGDERRYRLGLVLLLTARGIPMLCYGDEAGLPGAQEPWGENRRSMRFDTESGLFRFTKALIALRRGSEALRRGFQKHLAMDRDLYAFARLVPDQQAIVVFNLATAPRDIRIPLAAPLPDGARAVMPAGLPQPGVATPTVRNGELSTRIDGLQAGVFLFEADSPMMWASECDRLLKSRMAPFELGTARLECRLRLDHEPASGSSVLLIGGLPQLGEWDAGSPVLPELARTASGTWDVAVDLPAGSVFECKFLIRGPDGSVAWQPGDNAICETASGAGIRLERTW
ncbi:MAG TPA: alpha-amylase family glycosyl hydrolase [Candidatus Ozemobacteraceae bacterium]